MDLYASPLPPDPAWTSACASQTEICVEVAAAHDGTWAIRDSKLGDNSPVLRFTSEEIAAFLTDAPRIFGRNVTDRRP